MKITNHKLDDTTVNYKETPNTSGPFQEDLPDTIVIHYTAGSTMQSSANWLRNPKAKASAHLVIGKSGNVEQLAPFNVVTWHAGKSKWDGRYSLNNYSIGIEIDNAGLLEKRLDGYYASFGKRISDDQVVIATHKNENIERAWEAYTPEQLDATETICLLLKEAYQIKEIVGHDDIAPKRKRDPGPAFPLHSLRNKILFGRHDESEEDLPELSAVNAFVTASYLNIRSKPSLESTTITDPLPKGTRLKVLKSEGGWSYVKVEIEGWVSSQWVKKV